MVGGLFVDTAYAAFSSSVDSSGDFGRGAHVDQEHTRSAAVALLASPRDGDYCVANVDRVLSVE